jgi:hypothetical protein
VDLAVAGNKVLLARPKMVVRQCTHTPAATDSTIRGRSGNPEAITSNCKGPAPDFSSAGCVFFISPIPSPDHSIPPTYPFFNSFPRLILSSILPISQIVSYHNGFHRSS